MRTQRDGSGPDAHSQGERRSMKTNTTGAKGERRGLKAAISVFAIILLVASSLSVLTSESKDNIIENSDDLNIFDLNGVLGGSRDDVLIDVAAGSNHSLALKSDGTVWAWGDNQFGQLGDNTNTSRSTPVQVNLSGVTAIAAGNNFSLALKSDGTVWAWGANGSGQLGYNASGTGTSKNYPVQVVSTTGAGNLTGITAISAGSLHVLALRYDGAVFAWGNGGSGRLGNNFTDQHDFPVQVVGAGGTGTLTGVTGISAGDMHSLALKSDGTVWVWGNTNNGAMGNNNSTVNQLSPVQVWSGASGGTGTYLTGITAIAAGSQYSLALRSDGTVWAWGRNNYGQLGDNTSGTDRPTPVQVVGAGGSGTLRSIAAISAKSYSSMALRDDGAVFAWGRNTYGQLGDNTSGTDRLAPVQVVSGAAGGGISLMGITAIATGDSHSLALRMDGTVWAWGYNFYGQLGDNSSGTGTNKLTPVRVTLTVPKGVTAIAAGDAHMLALRDDGTVWAWGNNYYGQLGDSTSTDRPTPVQVHGANDNGYLTNVIAIAAGSNHSLALKSDGTVWTWGYNNYGQLGDNSSGLGANKLTPVQVHGFNNSGYLYGVTAIDAGENHSLALKSDGTVWAWGYNTYGQLGNGYSGAGTNKSTPVQVVGTGGIGTTLTGITAIDAGQNFSVALRNDGYVFTWGENGYGQLGNNSLLNNNVPVVVMLTAMIPLYEIKAISAGGYFALAIRNDGTVWGWGGGGNGQLGDGNTTTRNPMAVQVRGGATGNTYLTGITAISTGALHSLALRNDGTVWAWGYNASGQLGDGTSGTDRSTPVQVRGGATGSTNLMGITAISAGFWYSAAIRNDGTVWAWGHNSSGQMGNNTGTNTNSPVRSAMDNTPPVPGNNGTTTVTNITYNSLTLNWTAATDDFTFGAIYYHIYQKQDSTFTMVNGLPTDGTPLIGVSSTTYNVTGLTPNTLYYFVVVAVDYYSNKAAYRVVSEFTSTQTLTGTATISNTAPKIGDTLTASLTGTNNTGTLRYQWQADGANVGTNSSTYTVAASDLAMKITVRISSSVQSGTITSAQTAAVVKKTAAAPGAPVLLSKTHENVTLVANSAYLYSKDGTTWQVSNSFSGLSPSTAYTFYQRFAETSDTLPSPSSTGLTVTTDPAPVTPLTGTAVINNTAPKIGDTLNASLNGGNNTGTLSYQWKADGANVGANSSSYTVAAGDLGKRITVSISSSVQSGTITSAQTSPVVKKPGATGLTAPVLSSKTYNSVTLMFVEGNEYSTDGTTWQASNTFTGLSPSTAYTFYRRVAETSDTLPSAASPGLNVMTDVAPAGALMGSAVIDNTAPKIGDTLNASLNGGNNTGTLSYQWKADGANVGANSSVYTVAAGDLGKTITVTITSSVQTGNVPSAQTSPVVKKPAPAAPAAPVASSTTYNSVTLTATGGYEYSMNGTAWQPSNVFAALSENTPYTFYQRIAETSDTLPSASSPVLNVTTSTASASDLQGTAVIDNTAPKVGDTLTASLVGGNNTGTLSYQWKANNEAIAGATGSTYTVKADDLGKIITVTITSSVQTGSVPSTGTSAVTEGTTVKTGDDGNGGGGSSMMLIIAVVAVIAAAAGAGYYFFFIKKKP